MIRQPPAPRVQDNHACLARPADTTASHSGPRLTPRPRSCQGHPGRRRSAHPCRAAHLTGSSSAPFSPELLRSPAGSDRCNAHRRRNCSRRAARHDYAHVTAAWPGPAETTVGCRAGVPDGGAGAAGHPVGASLATNVLQAAGAPVPVPAASALPPQAAEGRPGHLCEAPPGARPAAYEDRGDRTSADRAGRRLRAPNGTAARVTRGAARHACRPPRVPLRPSPSPKAAEGHRAGRALQRPGGVTALASADRSHGRSA